MERGRGFPWDMLESVVCWGVAGAGALWAPRGAVVEDLQNVMDPSMTEELLDGRAESRCGQEGRKKMCVRAVHVLRLHRAQASGAEKV